MCVKMCVIRNDFFATKYKVRNYDIYSTINTTQ